MECLVREGKTAKERARQLVRELKSSFVPENLKSICEELTFLAEYEKCCLAIEDLSVHRIIVDNMAQLASHPQIQTVSCELLAKLMKHSKNLYESFVSYQPTLRAVLEAMDKHANDKTVQAAALQAICYLSKHEKCRLDLLQHDVVHSVLLAISLNADSPQTVSVGCQALCQLFQQGVVCPSHRKAFKDEYRCITAAIDKFKTNAEVLQNAFWALGIVAQSEDVCEHLLSQELHTTAIHAMERFAMDPELQTAAVALLQQLPHSNETRTLLVLHGIPDAVLKALKDFPDHPLLQQHCLNLLHKLGETMFSLKYNDTWLQEINRAMINFRHIPKVQEAACLALTTLLKCYPHLCDSIGESRHQIAVHLGVLTNLMLYKEEEDLFSCACEALFWMCIKNESVRTLAMLKGVYVCLLNGLRSYTYRTDIQSHGLAAIRGLCAFCKTHKEKMMLLNIMGDILKACSTYPDCVEVVTECIALIACIADVEPFKYQCITEGIHERIIDSMLKFSDSMLLQEISMEALAILATADGVPELMEDVLALDIVMKAMEKFDNNEDIQKKGLVLFQVLVSNKMLFNMTFCENLVERIVVAMEKFKSSFAVQVEACVTLRILVEMSDVVSRQLIDREVHVSLFELINAYSHDKDCVDLVSECLYFLLCVRELKNEVLLSMAKKDNFLAVEILIQLGAEPNIGEGKNTPLYFACLNDNAEMVRLLLDQGVPDVQGSLRHSLTSDYSVIIALLLSHLGFDQHAGIVSWSGLNLGDLRPEWFDPIFCAKKSKSKVSSLAKEFVEAINKTEERIEKRKEFMQRINEMNVDEQEEANKINLYCPKIDWKFSWHKPGVRYVSQDSMSLDSLLGISSDSEIDSGEEADDDEGNDEGDDEFPSFCKSDSQQSISVFIKGEEEYQQYNYQDDILISPLMSSTYLSTINRGRRRSSRALSVASSLTVEETEYIVDSREPSLCSGMEEWENTERDDWLNQSMTSANVPFNLNDPRSLLYLTNKSPHRVKEEVLPSYNSSQLMNRFEGDGHTQSRHSGSSTPALLRPPKMAKMDPLRSMRRSSTTLAVLPSFHTHKVRQLDVSSNSIPSLDSLVEAGSGFMARFSHLERLDLSGNSLQEFPNTFFQEMPKLSHLELRNNKISSFPSHFISNNSSLVVLDISRNQISNMEKEPEGPSFKLVELNLSSNSISWIPEWLNDSVPGLELLNLSRNKLDDVESSQIKLKRLKNLNISHNKIKEIPNEFISNCLALEILNASCNELEHLPSHEIARKMKQLHTLKLAFNKLAQPEPYYIPKFILYLNRLKNLDLSNNELTGIPEIGRWSTIQLKELVLSHNNIKNLVLGEVANWRTDLERLVIGHNDLEEVPRDVGSLKSLACLDFSHNPRITSIPDEIGNLSHLWEMPLKGLKLDLDPAITDGRVKDIVHFLNKKYTQAVPHYRLKIMVLGFGNRGKTSLLSTLMGQRTTKGHNLATVGIDVKEWKLRPHNQRGITYNLSTWDFAGQEDFFSTHPCFLSARSVYLIVYDLSRGPSELKTIQPWLLTIHARAPKCPVIIVGTHVDKISKDKRVVYSRKIKEEVYKLCNRPGFPTVYGFVEVCSIKENDAMDKLRRLIVDTIDKFKVNNQPVMGQMIPRSYMKLEELVTGEAKQLQERHQFPVVKHQYLMSRIKKEKIDLQEEELRHAVRFLHEAGILLHYDDVTLRLKDYYFLDPAWLCRMMAQIVTLKQINPFINEEGVMERKDVNLLFTSREFPRYLINQYLRLLEMFEIVLPREGDLLIIPSRVPDKRPSDEIIDNESIACLHRCYKLPYTPIGFWPRLIARLIIFCNTIEEEDIGELEHQVNYWKEGIYVYSSEQSFFLVEPMPEFGEIGMMGEETFGIRVPCSMQGTRLLGHVVDNVDALIEEWFPGLLLVNPTDGKMLIQKFVPCTMCDSDLNNCHRFDFDELVELSEKEDFVHCPTHDKMVPLQSLAPDVVLGDLETKYQVKSGQFEFRQSNEFLLGDGGFSSVYWARYRDQPVAVKLFNKVIDQCPHRALRQEVTVLRRLKHLSLVSLLGVHLRPRIIIIELAPLGSLSSILQDNRPLSRSIQHRIAMQVAEGLAFLHEHKIIYRDLKPDNVLIFSLSLGVLVNAKISDYGISCFAIDLRQRQGTLGYMAPEVMKENSVYSFQADVFSFGIVLFELVTGCRPYEIEFLSELEDLFQKGHQFPQMTSRGCLPWPDLQDLMNHCTLLRPDQRPTAREVYERLNTADLLCLKREFAVFKGTAAECMAVRSYHDEATGEDHVEVWIGSGESKSEIITAEGLESTTSATGTLSWITITDHQPGVAPQGTVVEQMRVLSMTTLGSSVVLVGTLNGTILVYDAWTHSLKHRLPLLKDSVVCLKHYNSTKNKEQVIVGLANGELVFFDAQAMKVNPQCEPVKVVQLSSALRPGAVKCICLSKNKAWVGVGSRIIAVLLDTWTICKELSTEKDEKRMITCLALGTSDIWIARQRSSEIEAWHPLRRKKKISINCEDIIRANYGNVNRLDTYAKSMLLYKNVSLWIGMGGGYLILIDPVSYKQQLVVQRHTGPIRCIGLAEPKQEALGGPVVLTGGIGFVTKPGQHHNRGKKNKNESLKRREVEGNGYLIAWDVSLNNQANHLKTESLRRHEWYIK